MNSVLMMGALCAVPALVQNVAAAEPSANVARFGELMGKGLEITSTFLGVLKACDDKQVTAADAAKAVNDLSAAFTVVNNDLKALMEKLTPEDGAAIAKEMEDPELVEMFKQIEEMMKAVQAKLVEVKYYDSADLQAACEKFFEVTK